VKIKPLRLGVVVLCVLGIAFLLLLVNSYNTRPPERMEIEWRGVDTGFSNRTITGRDGKPVDAKAVGTNPARTEKEKKRE